MRLTWAIVSWVVASLIACAALFFFEAGIVLKPLARSVEPQEDAFFARLAAAATPSPFERFVLVDIDDAAWAAINPPSNGRAAPARPADRAALAADLNALRAASGKPAVVVVDIDVSPPASDDPTRLAAQEAALTAALTAWRDDREAPLLMLVRGEACASPPGAGYDSTARSVGLWRTSPYDALAAPSSKAPTNIAWVCALHAPGQDGLARRAALWGCATPADTPDGAPFGLPSPGLMARWVETNAGAAPASRFFAARGDLIDRACRADARASAELAPAPTAPVAFRFEYPPAEGAPLARVRAGADVGAWAQEGRFRNAAVIIGQTHRAAGDRWNTPVAAAMPGAVLVAAHLDTATRFETARPLPGWQRYGLVVGACLIFTIAFFVADFVRARLAAAMGDRPSGRAMAAFLLNPTSLAIWLTAGATTLLSMLLVGQQAFGSWAAFVYAFAAANLVLTVVGYMKAATGAPITKAARPTGEDDG